MRLTLITIMAAFAVLFLFVCADQLAAISETLSAARSCTINPNN